MVERKESKNEILTGLCNYFQLDPTVAIDEESEKFGSDGFLSFRKKIVLDKRIHVFLKSSDIRRKELGYLQDFSHYFSKNECIFYGFMVSILEQTRLRYNLQQCTPEVFFHRVTDAETSLAMDDLCHKGYHIASQNLTFAELSAIVTSLAHLQATYWIAKDSFNGLLDNHIFARGSKFEVLVRETKDNLFKSLPSIIESNWKGYEEHMSDFLNEQDTALLCRYFSQREHHLQRMIEHFCDDDSLFGIVNGDLWFSNIFLRRQGSLIDCRIVDWQFWRVGCMLDDLGMLLISSSNEDVIENHFEELVSNFYSTFSNLYFAATGKSISVTAEKFHSAAVNSLHFGLIWILMASNSLWKPNFVMNPGRLLKNSVKVLKKFDLMK